jgi:PAS domain S-box-containing protein
MSNNSKTQKELLKELADLKLENQSLKSLSGYDNTEQKHIDAEIKTILRTTLDGFYLVDMEGRILEVNESYCSMIGYTRQELLKMSVKDIEAIETEDVIKKRIQKIIKTGSDRFETKHKCKNGKEIDVEASVNYLMEEQPRLYCFMRNISGQKHAELDRQIKNEIIRGITTTSNLNELLKLIHQSLGKALYAENCFVALYDQNTQLFSFPYFVDKFDQTPEPLALLKSCTAYVFRTGKTSLITQELFDKLVDWGEVELIGTNAPSWIGVPLKTPAKTIGVLVLQHYEEDDVYSEGEVQFLDFVGSQIALAIERKRAEDELRQREVMLNVILQSTADGILAADGKGKVIKTNKRFAELWRIPQFIIDSEDDNRLLEFVLEQLTNPEEFISKVKLLYNSIDEDMDLLHFKDGRIFERCSAPLMLNNALNGRVWSFRDITTRKRAEESLLKLSRAVEQGPATVVITNRGGDIEYVNQKFCDLTGYSKEEVEGKNPRILNSGVQDKKFYEELWNTILSGNNWSGELLNKKKNGELYWESALISPLINNNGDITNFVAVKEDITLKKDMISALIEAKDKAELANRLKDSFIANISHEIRTPLSGMVGMTNLIRETFQNNIQEENDWLFDGVDYSSKRIIRTVDMILNYSRLQVGEFHILPEEIQISTICTNLIKDFESAAKYKSIELSFQNNFGDKAIIADQYSITMAISNLIDNAIKYTDKGSINVILHIGDNDDLILDVKDTGIGIDKEYLDYLFEPYRQEQMGYGRAYEGIGLGLSIVKKVLEMNKAVISVVSKKGEGTTFSINFGKVELLVLNKSNTDIPANILPSPDEIQKVVVLLVEDDLINQVTIKKFIRNRYIVITTDSSDEAMEILKKGKIDLILMDISIRGSKNGLELTKDLKESKEFSHIPVIAVTAHAFEVDRQNALKAGCDSYLVKPFTRESLLNMMSVYITKS